MLTCTQLYTPRSVRLCFAAGDFVCDFFSPSDSAKNLRLLNSFYPVDNILNAIKAGALSGSRWNGVPSCAT